MAISLSELLKKLLEMNGSDLHITTNSPPQIRVDGHLRPLDMPPMTAAETKQLAYSVLTDAQKHRSSSPSSEPASAASSFPCTCRCSH